MAAESVGLAASIAGLVSLGLQITGGIASYLDALESRRDELASVRRQNEALAAALDTIQAATSHNFFQSHQHDPAIEKNTQCCKEELQAVEELLAALADCDTTTWRQRFKNKKKKLTYAFDRPKVKVIVQRLQNANGILQLTLAGLGLDISTSHSESLAAIETGSRNHASELLLLRSEVTTALTPVYEIRDQMPHFERKLDSTTDRTLSHAAVTSAQMRESDRAAQEDFRRSHDLLQATMDRQLEKLQAIESLQRETLLVSRAASKPAALRELCDTITGAKQAPRQNQLLHGRYRQPSAFPSSTTWSPQFDSLVGRIRCTCPRPYRSTVIQGARLGHLRLSKKSEVQGHWPACPLSNTANKSRRSIGFGYSGLASILHAAVDFSFTMTSGAGGFSISPNLSYYATVDDESDPAFRTLELLRDCTLSYKGSIDLFAIACIKTIVRLFDDKKACPTAVTSGNRTLLHSVVKMLEDGLEPDYRGSKDMIVFFDLVKMLRGFGVPKFTFDSLSAKWLFLMGNYYRERAKNAINILLQANPENQPPVFRTPSVVGKGANRDVWYITFGILDLYEECPGYAEVSEVDIYGHTVLHLAAGKPQILQILLEFADLSSLEKANIYRTTALTVAMQCTGRLCINGTSPERCRSCGCTQCVDILLEAGCNTKTRNSLKEIGFTNLFRPASELARRRYVVHMRATRISRMRPHLTLQYLSKRNRSTSSCTDIKQAYHQLRKTQHFRLVTDGVESDYDWIFREIHGIGLADLFFRYGFYPSPSFFYHVRTFDYILAPGRISYFRWLVEHGADPFFRLPTQPPDVHSDSDIGLYAAHFAGWVLGSGSYIFNDPDHFEELSGTVLRENLKDGKPWLESKDIVIINQEQSCLLHLHGQLVEELTEAAVGFIKTDPEDRSLFPDFWGQCWIPRIEEELDKLSGSSLTDAEIRGAEGIGVRWCEQAREVAKKNPYDKESLEHWFYELDLLCPEYKEPWPEVRRRVEELS
ncbi:hypothetical protein PG991_001822 [Apiospora marii]|uniref:Fungal N-terminal domain-containing protein n=1 Tax=Apiospora marii TaxID=335849 RepID=A0ABR1SPW0_9PEZI